jgi:imidazolonepropionase
MAPAPAVPSSAPTPAPNPTSEVLRTSEVSGEVDLLIHTANQLLTLAGGPQRGRELGRLGIIEDGGVAVSGTRIVAVGPSSELKRRYRPLQEIDAGGRVVLPGFIDPHTHVVWSGDRAAEFELRLQGATYLQIMAAGGGIASTVKQTRQSSVEALMETTRPRLARMLAHGTTTAEAKTGYGLEVGAEIRMLDAILRLDAEGPLDPLSFCQ